MARCKAPMYKVDRVYALGLVVGQKASSIGTWPKNHRVYRVGLSTPTFQTYLPRHLACQLKSSGCLDWDDRSAFVGRARMVRRKW